VKQGWNIFVVTGDLVYTYFFLRYNNPVTDVAFHPFDNMVAFCSYGESHLVKMYTYDYKGNFRNFLFITSCRSWCVFVKRSGRMLGTETEVKYSNIIYMHVMLNADAKMILMPPPPEDCRRPPGHPCITWLNMI